MTPTDLGNGLIAVDGGTYRNTWKSSGERFTGDVICVSRHVVDPGASETGDPPNIILSIAIGLTNDGGSWLGECRCFGSADLDLVTEMYTLVGQGGYEGLGACAIAETAGREPAPSGTIFPTAMPGAPEPCAGE